MDESFCCSSLHAPMFVQYLRMGYTSIFVMIDCSLMRKLDDAASTRELHISLSRVPIQARPLCKPVNCLKTLTILIAERKCLGRPCVVSTRFQLHKVTTKLSKSKPSHVSCGCSCLRSSLVANLLYFVEKGIYDLLKNACPYSKSERPSLQCDIKQKHVIIREHMQVVLCPTCSILKNESNQALKSNVRALILGNEKSAIYAKV